MKATTFVVIRHGETKWNLEHRMMGISDIPLADTGLKQAQQTALYLKGYALDIIVTSPLLRAIQTATAIQNHHAHIPIVKLNDLHERSFGILEGKTYIEANALYPQITFGSMWQYPNFKPPKGESITEVASRAKHILADLLATYKGKTIAVVSHGSFIRNFLSVFLELPLEEVNKYGFSNASISIVSHTDARGGEAHIMNKTVE